MEMERYHKKCHRYIKTRKWLSLQHDPRRSRFSSALRKLKRMTMCKLARKYRRKQLKAELDGSEPMIFTTRIVLRSRGRLPARRLVRLHQYHKNISILATYEWAVLRAGIKKCMGSLTTGLPATDSQESIECLENQLRHLVRTVHEERLKGASQTFHVAHCDLVGLNPRSQQLLEHFFATIGVPNAAEAAVLSHMGLVGVDIVNKWFTEKQEREVQLMPGYEDEWYREKVWQRNYWRYKVPYSRF